MARGSPGGGKNAPSKQAANTAIGIASSFADEGNRPQEKPVDASNIFQFATKDEVKKLIDHLKEIHDQKFENIKSEITKELARINDIPTSKELAWGIVGLVGILITFVLGMLAIMGDRWDNGLSNGSVIGSRIEKADIRQEEMAKNMDRLIQKMDRIIDDDNRKK